MQSELYGGIWTAGAGGLQAPFLACGGADVTVIDISNKMLEKDREIAIRENLRIDIIKGNMCELSMFGNTADRTEKKEKSKTQDVSL